MLKNNQSDFLIFCKGKKISLRKNKSLVSKRKGLNWTPTLLILFLTIGIFTSLVDPFLKEMTLLPKEIALSTKARWLQLVGCVTALIEHS